METNGMIITVKQSNNIYPLMEGIGEIAVFSVIAVIYFFFKDGFEWFYLLCFGIPLAVLLLIAAILKLILTNRYFKIDTLKDLFEVRSFIKKKTYALSSVRLESKIQVDDGKDFYCKLKFYYNDKKIYSVYNKALKPNGLCDKSFYKKMCKHINVIEYKK